MSDWDFIEWVDVFGLPGKREDESMSEFRARIVDTFDEGARSEIS